jgi:thiosulfate/3-mercaptopyruvate sulfurtransferase
MAAHLVEVQALYEELAAGEGPRVALSPTVLDVRWTLTGPPGYEAYRLGHLPGARFCDLDQVLAGPPGSRGRHPLPDADDFGAAMSELGVDGARPVVVYDAADSMAAARAWWCLRYFGHHDVRVLNGGYAAWVDAGLPVEVEEPEGSVGDFVAAPGHAPVVDAAGAADVARRGRLVDVRVPARYRGELEPIDPVAGHVPGAINLPAGDSVDGHGRFLPPDQLRARFTDAGLLTDAPVAAYCGSGVTAAHLVLALALVDQPAALYAGSWSEWIADPARPVAAGARRWGEGEDEGEP